MAKLGAVDTCHLHVANCDLRLLCAKDGRLLVAWPFTCLRRYMSTRGRFTVEAGRRAPTGEGKFTFLTPQHDEIYKLLDKVVKSRAGQKTSTPPSQESLRKTQSVPIATASVSKVDSQNGYDQLVFSTSASFSSADDQLSPGMTNSMKNTYSAPYGHLPSRDLTQMGTPLPGQGVPQILPGSRLSAESEVSDQYNTLSQPVQDTLNQPVQGKQGVGEDGYNTLNQHLLSAQEYNVLNHGPKQQMTSRQQETEDVYNVIGETLHPVTIPAGYQVNEGGYNTLSTSRNNASAPEETYNTLDHGSLARSLHKGSHRPGNTQGSVRPAPKPTARRLFEPSDKQLSSVAEAGDMQSEAKPPLPPARKTPELASQSVDEGSGLYNSLEMSKARSPAPNRRTSEQLRKLQKSQSLMVGEKNDMYNKLDTCSSKVAHPLHVDVSPLLTKINRQACSLDNLDSYASIDASSTLETTRHQTTSLDDLDSYARIDYVSLSPAKGAVKQPPVPKQRSSPSKVRKSSAPDVLSLAGHHSGKELKKPGKSGLVSNLKASLEAGGLDLTKLPRKPKNLSREGSEELPTHAEVEERGASQVMADDVFVAGTPPTRPGRSQSSPSDAKPGDDIYAELDQTAQVRPKSLQITKLKKNTKK